MLNHIILLTPKQVRRIHTRILSGDELSGEYEGRLDGALGRIENRITYQIGIKDIFDVAGCYAAFITTAHAFTDGNKRTGFRASLAILGLNGIEPDFQQLPFLEYCDLIVECAKGQSDEFALAHCLRQMHMEFLTTD